MVKTKNTNMNDTFRTVGAAVNAVLADDMKREPQTQRAARGIAGRIDEITARLNVLTERLSPVMFPRNSVTPRGEPQAAPAPALCPLAETLAGFDEQLEGVAARLDGIIESLEV